MQLPVCSSTVLEESKDFPSYFIDVLEIIASLYFLDAGRSEQMRNDTCDVRAITGKAAELAQGATLPKLHEFRARASSGFERSGRRLQFAAVVLGSLFVELQRCLSKLRFESLLLARCDAHEKTIVKHVAWLQIRHRPTLLDQIGLNAQNLT